jgi:hypothetical protein
MAVKQPGYFNLQEFTDIGELMVGGRLYTYLTGTTTHATMYTDAAGAVAHTYTSDGIGGQYIALNARGELPQPLYMTTGQSYDIALKTPAGATVWTRRADSALDPTIPTFTQQKPYVITAFISGVSVNNVLVIRAPFGCAGTFPINMEAITGIGQSKAISQVAATAQANYDFRVNDVSKGTIRWAAAGTVATFVGFPAISFAASDWFSIVGPATFDTTLASLGFTLVGQRT